MVKARRWCDVCRGEDELFSCSSCPRSFHSECLNLPRAPEKGWKCDDCQNEVNLDAEEEARREEHKKRQASLRKKRTQTRAAQRTFLLAHEQSFAHFVKPDRLKRLRKTFKDETTDDCDTTVPDSAKRPFPLRDYAPPPCLMSPAHRFTSARNHDAELC